jgi:hypothetical protein
MKQLPSSKIKLSINPLTKIKFLTNPSIKNQISSNPFHQKPKAQEKNNH